MIEQHKTKRYQVTTKFTLIRVSHLLLASIKSKWIFKFA